VKYKGLDIVTEIRCQHCGRLLAKETDGVIDIKTTIKQRILVGLTSITFFCPWLYFNHQGRKLCGKKTIYQTQAYALSFSPNVARVA
jgi:hypothetical protein